MRTHLLVAAAFGVAVSPSTLLADAGVVLLSSQRRMTVAASYVPSDLFETMALGPLTRQLYTSYAPYSSSTATQNSNVTVTAHRALLSASGSGNQYGWGNASSTYLVRFALESPQAVDIQGSAHISFSSPDSFTWRGASFEVVLRSITTNVELYRLSQADTNITSPLSYEAVLPIGEYELFMRASGSGGGLPWGNSGLASVDAFVTVPSPGAAILAGMTIAGATGRRRRSYNTAHEHPPEHPDRSVTTGGDRGDRYGVNCAGDGGEPGSWA